MLKSLVKYGKSYKDADELELLRAGGKVLAKIVDELKPLVVEGSCSIEIDRYARFLCKKYSVKPAFLGYGHPSNRFPSAICANLNHIIVHGIPNQIKFKSGDIFGLDMGIIYRGYYLDMSVTIEIGEVEEKVCNFLAKTKKSMDQGIAAARVGNKVGDICFAMGQNLLGSDFSLMKDFVGHGIGRELHEPPEIPGFGMEKNTGLVLQYGMVLAIEAISVLGPTNSYEILKDRWSVSTIEKKYLSGLFEHTIIIGEEGPEIITIL